MHGRARSHPRPDRSDCRARNSHAHTRAPRHTGNNAHRIDDPARQDAGIGRRVEAVDDLFHRHDHLARCQCGFLLHAQNAPEQYVAAAVGPLGVDHGDIGIDCRRGGQRLAGIRALQELDAVVDARQIRADIPTQHCKRQPRRTGHIGIGHIGVAVFANLQRLRPGVFHRIAQPVQRTDAGIAAPGKPQRRSATGADQLVVDQVGSHAHQAQRALALANDLVPGRMRNQVCEAFHRHTIAIGDQLRHRIRESDDFGHCVPFQHSERGVTVGAAGEAVNPIIGDSNRYSHNFGRCVTLLHCLRCIHNFARKQTPALRLRVN